VGMITINVKGITEMSNRPPMSHQMLDPANQAVTEAIKPKPRAKPA